MKLSVIIPYYNGEQWVSKCLDSLLHQDIDSADYEIIVVVANELGYKTPNYVHPSAIISPHVTIGKGVYI